MDPRTSPRQLPKAWLACTLATASLFGNAFAADNFSVEASYRIELIDLDINDGITPGISLLPWPYLPSGMSINVSANIYPSGSSPWISQQFDGADYGTLSAAATATAGTTSSAVAEVHELSGHLLTQGTRDAQSYGLSGGAHSSLMLSLTPMSALRVTGALDTGGAVSFADPSAWTWISAQVSISSFHPGDYSSYGTVSADLYSKDLSVDHVGFDYIVRNTQAVSARYQLYASTYMNLAGTPAVPEPATYALMLVGLAALGLRSRHAKAKAD